MRICCGRLILIVSLALLGSRVGLHRSNFSVAGTPETPAQVPGASAAFTSDDPVVSRCRGLMEAGHFAQAEALLSSHGVTDPRAAEEMLEIMGRIRQAYGLDAQEMLARVRQSIPDATAEDIERWRTAGQLQYRTIDDHVAYFRREPANLFRFCPEAIKRRHPSATDAPAWKLEQHLNRVISAATTSGDASVVPIRHHIQYRLTIAPTAPGLKPGAVVRAWLPFPQEYGGQTAVRLLSASPPCKLVAPVATGDTDIAGAAQRSAYFEVRVAEAGKPIELAEEFEFTSSAFYPALDGVHALPLPADWAGGGLGERPPHILFTPRLRETAATIVGDETDPLARTRLIFRYVTTHIAYCAEEEYSTIPSLSDKCLTSGKGDCGVQAMLFITLCRAAGVPARWQSGWQTKREDGPDMHDWAEFCIIPKTGAPSHPDTIWARPRDKWGGVWLPADVTYGAELKDNPNPRLRDFYLGHLDSYRMIVNRDYGAQLIPPKPSFRSEPLDFQRGEVEIDGKNLYFPYWDYEMKVEWKDGGP
jgi:transglutaminase-like putative cysteine protease